ncbi:hypothetical protein CP960_11425 [Malaciobacter halophilus]|uniref:N-acetyltransferase domain-containing protein n=1 Tax=Malaciobacter halophilus TaxID=197482 RepID=A0A2N1J0I2_9BACT|nr:GNAT family N-acetyltransferase [Malaciobacter halophilus]AXH10357.1 acetyltransferase [Malaciobacter halophilus]PKI80046.1 hypothetical protein CP960_11425 [Malaciobacter halophilus]
MTITTAKLDDAKNIAKIITKTWETAFEDIVSSKDSKKDETFLTTIMKNNISKNLEKIFILKDKNRVVGFISGVETKCLSTYEIKGLYILPKYQGLGYGKVLLDTIIEYAKQFSYKKIYLQTLKGAKNNIFYERYGFKIEDEFMLKLGNNSYKGISFIKNI